MISIASIHRQLRAHAHGRWPDWLPRTAVVLPVMACGAALAVALPAVIDVQDFSGPPADPALGFAVFSSTSQRLGTAVTLGGDINNDGFDDFVITAPTVPLPPVNTLNDPFAKRGDGPGSVYVLFGRPSPVAGPIDVESLSAANGGDGSLGFRAVGLDPDEALGFSVAYGDFNGDGRDDLVITSALATVGSNFAAGRSYVLFGRDGPWPADFDLSSLLPENGGDASEGFVVEGVDALDRAGFGTFVDLNNDGYDELVIGAPGADFDGGSSYGQVYFVYGRADQITPRFDLAVLEAQGGPLSQEGFVLTGNVWDTVGRDLEPAGDVNGDGFDDLLILAPRQSQDDPRLLTQVYLLYGTGEVFEAQVVPSMVFPGMADENGFFRGMSISAGSADFWSYELTDFAGAGDVNGDGVDDLLLIHPETASGTLAFGQSAPWPGTQNVDLGDTNRIRIRFDGAPFASSPRGTSVAAAGDVDADGYDDFLFTSRFDLDAFLVFGGPDLPDPIRLDEFAAPGGPTSFRGVQIKGTSTSFSSAVGRPGDFNGDGVSDFVIGDSEGSVGGSGNAYLLFGDINADRDNDGVPNVTDNCLQVENVNQRDTDGDGFGNFCDPDLNNDNIVNVVDLGILRTVFFTADANADFDGDGVVNVTDLGIMRSFFFRPPGP